MITLDQNLINIGVISVHINGLGNGNGLVGIIFSPSQYLTNSPFFNNSNDYLHDLATHFASGRFRQDDHTLLPNA